MSKQLEEEQLDAKAKLLTTALETAQEIAQEMARLTLLTNKLNDVQLQNIKMFPFVFFDGVNEVAIDYDLSNNTIIDTEEDTKNLEIDYKFSSETNHLRVTYHLTIDQAIQQTHMHTRFMALEGSIRNLLWKEIKVQVFINGVKAFESQNEPK